MRFKLFSMLFVVLTGTISAQSNSAPSPWDKGQMEFSGSGKCPFVYPDYFMREREIMDYNPRYQPGMLAFSPQNVPVISFGLYPGQIAGSNSIRYASRFFTANHYLQTLSAEGKWITISTHADAIKKYLKLSDEIMLEIQAGERVFDEVAFDDSGNGYTIVNVRYTIDNKKSSGQFLLSSTDGMKYWQVLPLKGGQARLEPWRCHSDRKNPPAIICSMNGGVDVYLPNRNSDRLLELSEPKHLADASLKPIFNYSVSAGTKTFVSFMSGVESSSMKGSLQYVACYDRKTGKVYPPLLLGSTGDIVDGHNAPSMDVDSKGYIYIIGGAHWHAFKLWKSKKPYSMNDGWTDPEPIGSTNDNDWSRNGLTYPRLIIDKSNCLHLIARGRTSYYVKTDTINQKKRSDWDNDLNYGLLYFRKKAGGNWEPRVDLVVPKWMKYTNWYQKLVIDRKNKLYLTYYCFNMELDTIAQNKYLAKWPEDADNGVYIVNASRVHDPVVLTSSDSGNSWKLAETNDFISGKGVRKVKK